MAYELTTAADLAAVRSALGVNSSPPEFACLGDSISERNTSALGYKADGYLSQAIMYLKDRATFPVANNFGVSGENSAQILARIGSVTSSGASWCAVMAGINDPFVGPISKEQSWLNIKAIYDALLIAGINVLALPITPRSDGAMTAAARGQYYYINRKIRDYAKVSHPAALVVADTDLAYLDRTSGTGAPISPATADLVHPANYGGDLLGQVIFNALDPIIPRSSSMSFTVADVYDATNNPLGNRAAAWGQQLGTGGTAGPGCTGDISDTWVVDRVTGSQFTVVASKVARSGAPGGFVQRLTLGAGGVGAAAELMEFFHQANASGLTFAPGDICELLMEVDVAGLVNVQNIRVSLQDGTSLATIQGLAGLADTSNRIVGNWSKVIRTPPFLVPAGAANLKCRLYIEADCSGAGPSGTVDIGAVVLRTPA